MNVKAHLFFLFKVSHICIHVPRFTSQHLFEHTVSAGFTIYTKLTKEHNILTVNISNFTNILDSN